MKKLETLDSRTVLKAVVLGAVAAMLIMLHGQPAKAQTATIGKTEENEGKLAKRSEAPIPVNVPVPRPLQSCTIGAGLPQLNQADRILLGSGGRGSVCTSHANMLVKVKQDRRFWFDRTLGSMSGGGTNFELFARYKCRGTGSQTVYTEVKSGDKKVQSRRVGVFFCG